MIINIISIISLAIASITLSFWTKDQAEVPYVSLVFLMVSIICFVISIVYRKSFDPKYQGKNFTDTNYLAEGENEVKRIVSADITQSLLLSGSKLFMQDVVITNRRIILLGSTYMRILNLPFSIFYKKDEYIKFGNLFSFVLDKIERKNNKTYFSGKRWFLTLHWTVNDPEISDIVTRYKN